MGRAGESKKRRARPAALRPPCQPAPEPSRSSQTSQQTRSSTTAPLRPPSSSLPLYLRALATRCGRAPYFPRRREIRMGISVWPYLEPLSRLESAHLGTRCRAADEHCARAPRLPTPV